MLYSFVFLSISREELSSSSSLRRVWAIGAGLKISAKIRHASNMVAREPHPIRIIASRRHGYLRAIGYARSVFRQKDLGSEPHRHRRPHIVLLSHTSSFIFIVSQLL